MAQYLFTNINKACPFYWFTSGCGMDFGMGTNRNFESVAA